MMCMAAACLSGVRDVRSGPHFGVSKVADFEQRPGAVLPIVIQQQVFQLQVTVGDSLQPCTWSRLTYKRLWHGAGRQHGTNSSCRACITALDSLQSPNIYADLQQAVQTKTRLGTQGASHALLRARNPDMHAKRSRLFRPWPDTA